MPNVLPLVRRIDVGGKPARAAGAAHVELHDDGIRGRVGNTEFSEPLFDGIADDVDAQPLEQSKRCRSK